MRGIETFDDSYIYIRPNQHATAMYDYYDEILKMFPREIDQKVLKFDHKQNPQHFCVTMDDSFFAIDSDEIINGFEFMSRVLKVARKAWVTDDTNDDEPAVTIATFIDNTWYDLQYYHWQAPAHFLDDMVTKGKYQDMPDELVNDHHDFNWYLKKNGHVNKHTKQREAYKQFLVDHDIKDLDSAKAYLKRRGECFGKVKIGELEQYR